MWWPGRFFSGGGRGKFYAIKGGRYFKGFRMFERGRAFDKSSLSRLSLSFPFEQIYRRKERMDFKWDKNIRDDYIGGVMAELIQSWKSNSSSEIKLV